MKIGSICSGIEAASVAWGHNEHDFMWFSEIAPFQSKFLANQYPTIPNLGDLTQLPERILSGEVPTPELICGGTPCQAFSVTGHQKGLEDDRGQLTLKFIEVIEANDKVSGKNTLVFWENVEGVLKDKTNAFGCFISGLTGCDDVIDIQRWPSAGLVRGPLRNVAWRVLDAKFFGVPQQRRRLYVVAGGPDFHPENILFEHHTRPFANFNKVPLTFTKEGKKFEVFREYTDCVYSAYATKWNGNAAAYNGSLYVCEDGRLRRMTPLETERLMGFPDDYTNVPFAKRSSRYHGVGNSWAVPVVRWLGTRMFAYKDLPDVGLDDKEFGLTPYVRHEHGGTIFLLDSDTIRVNSTIEINVSATPETVIQSNIKDIIDTNAEEEVFISPVGCKGILRRAIERGMKMNPRLQSVMEQVSSEMSDEEIEKISRVQPRGAYTLAIERGEIQIPQKKRRNRKPKTDEPVQGLFDF